MLTVALYMKRPYNNLVLISQWLILKQVILNEKQTILKGCILTIPLLQHFGNDKNHRSDPENKQISACQAKSDMYVAINNNKKEESLAALYCACEC